MYELTLNLPSTYVGPERRLSVPMFFRLFQDAAIFDAEQIGYGQEKTDEQELLWVFSRVYVRFHSMPEYQKDVTFETHPGGKKAFFFLRYGTLRDHKGQVAAELSSVWALIHRDTRKVEMRPSFDSVDQTNGREIPLPGKIEAKPCKPIGTKTIEYCDLDLNGHLNNVRYIEMLLNANPASFYEKHQIKELLIHYESEIHSGETVQLSADEGRTYIRGTVGDRICFEANLIYEPLK